MLKQSSKELKGEGWHNYYTDSNRKPTKRQLEILSLVKEGYANKQIGFLLGITEYTVKIHLSVVFNRLDAQDRTLAVINAIRRGYLSINKGDYDASSMGYVNY